MERIVEKALRPLTVVWRALALTLVLCATGGAWADTTKENPVTGETETYVNTFTGSGSPAEWNDAGNWDTGNTPFISGNYDPALVSNRTVSTSTAIDGWTLRVGAYNGASVTWSGGIRKIQAGSVGCWLTADETSSITIASFAGNQLEGSDSAPFKLTSANAGGITWSAGITSASNTSLPFWYYLKGAGTVVYGGNITVANAQVIKQADITLSGTSQVASKTLVTFDSGTTKAFTADATINVKNSSGTVIKQHTLSTVNSSGTTTLTTASGVGACELVQTSTGIVLYWVDGDPTSVYVSDANKMLVLGEEKTICSAATTLNQLGISTLTGTINFYTPAGCTAGDSLLFSKVEMLRATSNPTPANTITITVDGIKYTSLPVVETSAPTSLGNLTTDGINNCNLYTYTFPNVVVKAGQSYDVRFNTANDAALRCRMENTASGTVFTAPANSGWKPYGVVTVSPIVSTSPVAGSRVILSNTGSSAFLSSSGAAECQFGMMIPAMRGLPAGSVVRVKNVSLASWNDTFKDFDSTNHKSDPYFIKINNIISKSVKNTSSTSDGTPSIDLTNSKIKATDGNLCNRLFFEYANECDLTVGTAYAEATGSNGTSTGLTLLYRNGNLCYGSGSEQAAVRHITAASALSTASISGAAPVYEMLLEVISKPSTTATIDTATEYTLTGLFSSIEDDSDYVINVTESATLNIDTASSALSVTFNITEGKTLTLTGSNTLTATAVIVNGGTLVDAVDIAANITVNEDSEFVINASRYDCKAWALNAVAGVPYRMLPMQFATINGSVTIDSSSVDLPDGYSYDITNTSHGPVMEFTTDKQFGSLNINFSGGRNSVVNNTGSRVSDNDSYSGLMHGASPVIGTSWNDVPAQNASDVAVAKYIRQDGSVANSGTATITLSGVNNPYTTGSNDGDRILFGYCDDGGSPVVTINNIPFAKYRVIAYAATDTPSTTFCPKTINGVSYSTAAAGSSATPTVAGGTGAWGDSNSRSTLAEGVNYLVSDVIEGASTVTINNIKTAELGRAAIPAVQIVEVGVNNTYDIDADDTYTFAEMFGSVSAGCIYEVNVNESATLNIADNATAGKVTFNVAEGKVLTITGSSTLTATTIVINGGVVKTSTGSTFAGTLNGNGTVVYTAAPSGVTLTDATWTGTVWLKGIEVTNFRTDAYANSTSGAKVKVSGVTGWISTDYASNAELILDDDTYGFAFKATNANSLNTDDRCSTWKKLSGSGLLTTDDNNYQTPCVKIYDASGFTGSINANAGNVKLVVVFCAENETFSPSIFNRLGTSNGKILVSAGSSGVSVAAGKTWTAPGGIFIDGSLTVNAGATIPAIATGSTGGITAIGGATINGVIDSEISASLEFGLDNLSVVDASVTELMIPADTTPSAETFHPFMGSEKLDLTGCTSLMTLKLNLGASSTFDLSKVLLPESCTTVMIDVGSGRDLTGYSVSNLGTVTFGFSVTETKEEYANGTFSVANVPSGATVSVARGNGTTSNATVTDGTARFADHGTVKISGDATDLDLTCTNTIDFAYSSFTGASTWRDYAPVYTEDGVYARACVYTSGTVGNYIANNSSSMTLAVVGQMSPTANTIFLSLGNSAASGLLLARTAKTDEVTIGYNDGSTVHKITNMTVPNCATSRHVYIITKEDGETTTTFTVYLDGIKWKTLAIAKLTLTGGGVQVGADFGGGIRNNAQSDYDGAAFVVIPNSESETGVLNAIRMYGRVITPAEIAEYTTVFPYTSPNGSSARTFTAANEDWIDMTEASEVWVNSTGGNSGTPLSGAAINVTANVETEVTVNLASETTYEALTIGGAATTFVPGINGGDVKVTGMTVIGTTVTNKYGAVDMSGGPMTITQDGDITFDYSAYDISDIYTTTDVDLTGEVDENSTRVHLIAPSAEYRTASLVYTSDHQYVMHVALDHEAGSDVYYAGGYWGTTEDTFAVTNADGAATIVLSGDTVVIPAYYEGDSAYFGATLPANVAAIRVEKDFTFESGVDDTAILGGATVTVADGCTLSFATTWHNLTLGAVTFDGDGSVSIPTLTRTASITGAVSGTATLTIGGTVNVPSTGSIANAVTGDGRVVFEGALPTASTLLTSLQDSSSWTGTVELKDYEEESESFGIINFGEYGNRNSAVALNGVTSTMFTGNGKFPAYPDVTLREIEICEGGWTDGSTGTFSIDPTYTAKLTGRGPITVTTGGDGSVKFIGDHTFDGSVAFGNSTGKQVAFMKTSGDALPSVTAKSVVVAGRSNMSIASGKTWTAPGGVKLDGSLTVRTAEKATATSVTPTAYLDGASLTTTVDGEAGTTTYVTDEVTQISDNQASLGAVTVSEPKLMTGSGGAYMSSLTINDGMTLTYDPVITPLRVESAPVFNGTGKLKLAARYAGVTCGKFHLVSYPSSESVSGTLEDLVDSTSFSGVSYTVTEETVGSYKQLVLKVGGYDTNAKDVSIAQFGDSITEGIWRDGYRGTPNYRIPLMQLLEAYGYRPEARGYRSVGSTDANGVPADDNYKWHTGISAQRIYTGLTSGNLRAGFMESIEAHLEQVGVTDIITLKIGTNDSIGNETADNMFEGWSNLVWKIVRMRPTSKIVVCAPIKIRSGENNAPGLRTKIADYMALTYEQGGFPNGQVTMINGINIVTDDANYYLTDNVHPNWNGHLQLANGWLPAVTNAIESMAARATTGYTAQTVASAADAAELAAYRAGYVKLATFTNFNAKLSTWSESPYVSVDEAYRTMPMRRVAYFVARKTTTSPDTRYVWVDMDADETTGTTLAAFGMPTNAAVNGVVNNLHIYSNSSAIENVAPTVSGVKGTLMRTEKGVSGDNGIATAPDGMTWNSGYGFDWNDSINGSGAWGVMNMARIFDGVTPTNHRKLLAAQMLFDFNGFNGGRQNALGLGDFAVHGPYNTANGSVDNFNLNWTFTTDKDEMPTMDATALEIGVIEIWGKPAWGTIFSVY